MKQLFRDQIPDNLKAELEGARFVLLDTAPFGATILANGNDPTEVSQGNARVTLDKDGSPKPPHTVDAQGRPKFARGDLYRIDERQA